MKQKHIPRLLHKIDYFTQIILVTEFLTVPLANVLTPLARPLHFTK